MIALLAKRFLRGRSPDEPEGRTAYGTLCGVVGICLNLLLVAGKLLAGALSGSIAITADALNNLSDAGSSAVTLAGFHLAAKKADADHPFGHGRIEYLSGLAVAAVVVVTGFELGRSSLQKILHPQPVEFSALSAGILVCAIAVKLYMAAYNKRIGRRIGSTAMEATAVDSLSDCAATAAVLVCMLVSHFCSWHIDGWCGLLVACMILWAGVKAARDTIGPLLGEKTDPALAREIEQTVLSYEPVIGVHDLVVHDYGPGRRMVSLHAEVPCDGDLLTMHDAIDLAESALRQRFHCTAVIHMDPVECDNEQVNLLRAEVATLARELDDRVTIHDFRMVTGPTHTNLIFDLVLPFGLKLSDEEAAARLRRRIAELDATYFAVITVDKESC